MPADGDEEIVTFRLGPRDRAAIQRLVESGEFRNRSDFLRYAVKLSLDRLVPEAPRPKLDLRIEAVELPDAPSAPRHRNRASRARRGSL